MSGKIYFLCLYDNHFVNLQYKMENKLEKTDIKRSFKMDHGGGH